MPCYYINQSTPTNKATLLIKYLQPRQSGGLRQEKEVNTITVVAGKVFGHNDRRWLFATKRDPPLYSVLSICFCPQYRVESMMLRIAKPMDYIPVSPSVQQRARMKAPECIPLTLEPESCFYTDPVLVVDFQSLYPSIMIAYNYCFSTCLGRVESLANCR